MSNIGKGVRVRVARLRSENDEKFFNIGCVGTVVEYKSAACVLVNFDAGQDCRDLGGEEGRNWWVDSLDLDVIAEAA